MKNETTEDLLLLKVTSPLLNLAWNGPRRVEAFMMRVTSTVRPLAGDVPKEGQTFHEGSGLHTGE